MAKKDLQERLALLESRELTYSILSSSFLNPPQQNLIDTFSTENLFKAFPVQIDTANFNEALEQLIDWADQVAQQNEEEVLSRLKQDYNRLFVGPGHLLAPPWESVYLTEEKLTFGPPTLEVREFMRRHGLEFKQKNSAPDDHIGLEMEFMAELVHRQYEALEQGQEEQVRWLAEEQLRFLQEHLLKWVDLFTTDVIAHSKNNYYQGMARLAVEFLNWESQLLESSL